MTDPRITDPTTAPLTARAIELQRSISRQLASPAALLIPEPARRALAELSTLVRDLAQKVESL